MTSTLTAPAPTEALHDRQTLRLCTAGSVDDGKSTFVGRLLHDTKSVLADQLAAVEATSRAKGLEHVDLSLLVDGLRAEREQGITIDVAYRYFATAKRTFILADTPGHVQYTRNTVTGVSTSRVVVLLVDARNGIVTQTRRHLTAAALLGVDTVVLAVNKIDLVGFDESVYRAIEAEFTALAERLGVTSTFVVPTSALLGDNVVERGTNTDWYTGPTVLEILETVPAGPEVGELGFRFPVQTVIRDHATDYRGYAGRVTAGRIRPGDTVHLGSGRTTTVTGIDTPDGEAELALPGDSVVLRLADDIDLTRGDLIAGADRPDDVREFTATLVGLAEKAVRPGQLLKLRYGTSLVRGRVTRITAGIDIDAPVDDVVRDAPDELALNDIVRAEIQVAEALPVDGFTARGAVGSLLLIDPASGDTLAAGLVDGTGGGGGRD